MNELQLYDQMDIYGGSAAGVILCIWWQSIHSKTDFN